GPTRPAGRFARAQGRSTVIGRSTGAATAATAAGAAGTGPSEDLASEDLAPAPVYADNRPHREHLHTQLIGSYGAASVSRRASWTAS
ncbi:hypothetical protein OSJ00_17630, partial [Mycobacterium ulcerans]